MSILSFAALALYGAAIVSALSAGRRAWLFGRPFRNVRPWFLLALAYASLLIFRLFQGEDRIRDGLRDMLRSHQLYEQRRDLQAPLAVLVILVGALLVFILWKNWPRKSGRREDVYKILASLAAWLFLPLYGLRLVSLHAIDALLYAGPVRLNWILEAAICLATTIFAILYGEAVKRGSQRQTQMSNRAHSIERASRDPRR